MKRPPYSHKQKADMNVVPYIDVMLVLLVIFMVTAPMLTQGIKIDLPKVESEALPLERDQKIITLSVQANGSFYWNLGSELDIQGRTGNAEDVDAMVEQVSGLIDTHDNVQVYVRADADALYSAVVAGMASLQKAGITQLGLITEMPAQ
ncbi:MAG: protein TolR [Alcanivoracaceae bacterium]|jgi:biopolymer transport protein TolR|nr:protein TolR [Alcanivoracaceae bacterium]